MILLGATTLAYIRGLSPPGRRRAPSRRRHDAAAAQEGTRRRGANRPLVLGQNSLYGQIRQEPLYHFARFFVQMHTRPIFLIP